MKSRKILPNGIPGLASDLALAQIKEAAIGYLQANHAGEYEYVEEDLNREEAIRKDPDGFIHFGRWVYKEEEERLEGSFGDPRASSSTVLYVFNLRFYETGEVSVVGLERREARHCPWR